MSRSKCPSCDNYNFTMVEHSPSMSNFKYMFIQCSKCGAVVGFTDFYNVGKLVKDQEKKINNIESQLNHLTSLISNMRR
jgi:predicted nucleic-acid-binding Zn-ribbon protein